MTLDKTHLIIFVVGVVLGLICGFFSGKAIYDKPINEKAERDTVTLWDTIPHWYPVPVEAKPQEPRYKWLTKVENSTDTVTLHDSVLVEVPIESKHYNAPEYDAWVSGYEPSLDSIKIYQKTEYITKTITKVKPPSKFGIGVQCGYGYGILSKRLEPYVGFGVEYRF